MKVIVPNINEHKNKSTSIPYIEREANESYFNNIEDAKNYILNNCCDENYEKLNNNTNEYDNKKYSETQMIQNINNLIEKINNSIQKNKYIPFLFEEYKLNINYKNLLKNMTDTMKRKYEIELNELINIHKVNLNQQDKFIKDNITEIIIYLNSIKENYINNIKIKRQIYIKKWKQKRNEILNIKPREVLTEEQKIEYQKNYQKKYRETRNELLNIKPRELLTDEQKYENLKKSQKKYYENKKKINQVDIPIEIPLELPANMPTNLTAKELARKLCNKKYYDKTKGSFAKTKGSLAKNKLKKQESNKLM